MTRPTDMPQGAPRTAPDAAQSAMRHPTSGEPLSPQAQRALNEAAERRAAASQAAETRPAERNGPEGPEPTRYGDWEKGGIASDF